MSESDARLRTRGRRPAVLAALLLVAVVATYADHFDNAFHFDDSHVIQENAYVRDLGNVPLFFTDPETKSTLPTNRAYRPLLMVTFAVDYWLAGGLEPWAFHLDTFLWFLVQGVLMFLLYVRLLDLARPHRWNPLVSLGLVAWYMLHPANGETINYISARSDSLSTLCVVAGLVVDQRARGGWRHLAWVPVLLGVLIKSNAVMFVPLLWLQRLLFDEGVGAADLRRPDGRAAVVRQTVRILPGAALVAGLFWLTMVVTPETWTPGGTSPFRYLITQPFVMLRYFGMLFLPIDLTADTDWTALERVLDPRFFAGIAFVGVALWAAVAASNRAAWRPVAYGLLWFFLALLPSSSVVPLAEVTNDHRMFFPFVGLVLAAGWPLALAAYRNEARLVASRAARAAVAAGVALVLAFCAWGTHERNGVWDSEASLWYDVTVKSPRNGRGLMNYGLTRLAAGDAAGAEAYFRRARETSYGEHPYLYVNLALAARLQGRHDEAERHFQAALERSAGFPAVHFYYARWLHERGRSEEALRHLALVLAQSPGHDEARRLREQIAEGGPDPAGAATGASTPEALLERSLRLYQARRYEESLEAARRVVELRPEWAPGHNNVCAANNALGRWDAAIAACQRALEIDPGHELARNNLAWARERKAAEGQSR